MWAAVWGPFPQLETNPPGGGWEQEVYTPAPLVRSCLESLPISACGAWNWVRLSVLGSERATGPLSPHGYPGVLLAAEWNKDFSAGGEALMSSLSSPSPQVDPGHGAVFNQNTFPNPERLCYLVICYPRGLNRSPVSAVYPSLPGVWVLLWWPRFWQVPFSIISGRVSQGPSLWLPRTEEGFTSTSSPFCWVTAPGFGWEHHVDICKSWVCPEAGLLELG